MVVEIAAVVAGVGVVVVVVVVAAAAAVVAVVVVVVEVVVVVVVVVVVIVVVAVVPAAAVLAVSKDVIGSLCQQHGHDPDHSQLRVRATITNSITTTTVVFTVNNIMLYSLRFIFCQFHHEHDGSLSTIPQHWHMHVASSQSSQLWCGPVQIRDPNLSFPSTSPAQVATNGRKKKTATEEPSCYEGVSVELQRSLACGGDLELRPKWLRKVSAATRHRPKPCSVKLYGVQGFRV